MKSVIKKQHVSVRTMPAIRTDHSEVSPAAPPESCATTPGVRLVRVEGRVQAIELTCRCGDVSVLDIEYDDSPSSSEATS